MKKVKQLSFIAAVILVLAGSFWEYKIARAVGGEGTATIDGGANVTVAQATSHKFTVVLTIGVSGITANAQNPTFTIPAGFTAPDAAPVANAGLVVADGDWSVTAAGGTCTVENPTAGLTVAVGQLITVDVTTTCTVAVPDTITLTYQGQSASAMAATPLVVKTADDIGWGAVTAIAAPPTITVTAADITAPTVTVTMDDNALNIGDTSLVTFTFSETPVGFTTADVAVANGSIGAIDASNPLVQTAIYTPTNGIEDATNVITAGTAWTDAALNAGIGDDSPNYTIDTTAPAETITVIKLVVGGTKVVSDFPLFVNGSPVTSGAANSFPAPATYTVTETSNANYTASFSGFCPSGTITLALGTPNVCTITNTFTAPVVVSGGGSSYYPPPVPPLIDVVKVPSPLALPDGPGTVKYTYTLRNIGTVPVNSVTMVGDTCSPITLISGDTNADARLDMNETWIYTCSTTLSKTHTNIVTATGWANSISATDIASATVIVGIPAVPPLIHVTKVPNPLVLSAGGGMVTYTNKVTNPGMVALSNVRLADDKCGPVKYISGDTNNDNKLDTTETWVYTCQAKLIKTTVNTIAASGEANGLTARDFAIATVVVNAAVPKLPNTGFSSIEDNIPWNVIVPAGIFGALIFFCFARRKQTA